MGGGGWGVDREGRAEKKSESNVNKTPKDDSMGCFRFFEHIAME